jgi:hypothetical protein
VDFDDPTGRQNPHCEGVHSDRLFLSETAAERQAAIYEITNRSPQGTEYVIHAGDAIGITIDAEFSVYTERPPVLAPPNRPSYCF